MTPPTFMYLPVRSRSSNLEFSRRAETEHCHHKSRRRALATELRNWDRTAEFLFSVPAIRLRACKRWKYPRPPCLDTGFLAFCYVTDRFSLSMHNWKVPVTIGPMIGMRSSLSPVVPVRNRRGPEALRD